MADLPVGGFFMWHTGLTHPPVLRVFIVRRVVAFFFLACQSFALSLRPLFAGGLAEQRITGDFFQD
jgi:hypothetical protein